MPGDKTTIEPSHENSVREPLQASLERISSLCTGCWAGVEECRFLQRHGTPKQIAETFDPEQQGQLAMPFECRRI